MEQWLTPLTIAASVIGSVWTLAMWISKQFYNTQEKARLHTEVIKSAILDKLEYHERHDDKRFDTVSSDMNKRFGAVINDLWDIRVRNAARDGTPAPSISPKELSDR